MALQYSLPGTVETPREREQREQREFQRRLREEEAARKQAERQRVAQETAKLTERVNKFMEPVRRVQGEQTKFRQMASQFVRQKEAEKRVNVALEQQKFKEKASKYIGATLGGGGSWGEPEVPQLNLPPGEREKWAAEPIANVPEPGLGSLARFAMAPVVPPERNPLRRVPVVGEELARVTSPLTSPAGATAALMFPGATAYGTLGAGAGGLAGQGAEELGAPVIQTPIGGIGPRGAGELVGGVYGGPGGGGRRIAQPFAEGIEAQGGLGQMGRRLVTEEAGGTRIGHTGFPEEAAAVAEIRQSPLQRVTTKLATAVRDQRKANAPVKAARSAETGRRGADYSRILKEELAKGTPMDEADRIASGGALRGEYQPFQGVRIDAAPEETQAFTARLFEPDVKDFERKNLMSAFRKLSDKEPITDYYMNLIERLYPDLGAAIKESAVKKGTMWDTAYDIAVLPKALLSSFDMSYPFRQGVLSAPGHPIEFLDSFAPMVKAFASENTAMRLYRNAIDDPRVLTLADGTQMARGQAKSDIGLLRTMEPKLSTSEEAFRSNLAEKIPLIGRIVRGSNRAFTTFGNEFRSKMFDTITSTWERRGIPITEERLQSLGNMLNRFTGRGTLNKQGLTDALQAFWWSPQTRVAPAEALAHLVHPDSMIRAEAWRNWAAFMGTGSAILGAAQLAGANVTLDPRSTDFGKVVVGNTHLNIWGPLQPQVRMTAQLISGARIDAMRGALPADRLDTAVRYFRSGLAPEWSAVWDVLKGENYLGQPVGFNMETLKREGPERLLPLAVQDMYEAFKEEGLLAGALVGPATFFGESVSTYPPSPAQGLAAIPRWTGGNFTPREITTMETLWRRAADNRAEWYRDQQADVSVEDSLRITADAMNREAGDPLNKIQGKALAIDKNLLDWAILLETNEKARTSTPDRGGFLNPEWLRYLDEHEKELTEAGKGDFYTRKYIADALHAAREANSGR